MFPSGLWCASRARALCRPRSRTCSKLPRVFFHFPSTHATTVTIFSVFDTVPQSLVRGPLGEALVDMREKTEETKSGRKLWTRGPPRRTLWYVHRYIFLIVFLMTKFAPLSHEDPCPENPTSTREREGGRVQFCRACPEVVIILDDTRGRSLRCPAFSPSRYSGARHLQGPRTRI